MPPPRLLTAGAAAQDQRLDRFLRKRYGRLPIGKIHKLLRQRDIRVNGGRAKADTRLAEGDLIEVRVDLSGFESDPDRHLARAARVRASDGFRRQFRVLEEDDAILALDKLPGAVVHPGPGHRDGDTLLDYLRARLPESLAPDAPCRPGFVHRLDRGTSGVLLAAKTRDVAKRLEGAFRRGEVTKTYEVLVRGRPDASGRIELPIERDGSGPGPTRYRASRDAAPSGRAQAARTEFELVESWRGVSRLRVQIGTGRTHQIRVHLAAIGHPVAGDGDYGDRSLNRDLRARARLGRLFLHAGRLELAHPASGAPLRLESPLASDLAHCLSHLI